MKNLPKVLFAYPLFWMLSLVPIFWVIVLLVLVVQPKIQNENSSSKLLIPIILLPIASIPIGIYLEGNIPWSRIVSSTGYAIVWICVYKIYQGIGNGPDSKLVNSFLFLVSAQGMITLTAIFSPAVRYSLPVNSLDFLGSTGYGFSGKYLYYTDWLDSTVSRSAGISGNPTWAGAVALGGLVLAFTVLARNTSGSRKLAKVAIPLTLLNVYLSQSRSLWISLAIAAATSGYFIYRDKDKLTGFFITVILTIISATFLILKYNSIIQVFIKVDQSRVGSRYARADIYSATIEKIQEIQIPVLGYGFKPTNELLVAAIGSHSTYLGLLFRGGVLCLLAYLLFVLSLSKSAISANSPISIFAIIFIGLWSILEDVDAGHFALILFLLIYRIGLQQKTLKKRL